MNYTQEDLENGLNLPMSTSDAAGMLRVNVQRNGREYDNAVIRLNNKIVDDWKEKVLDRMSSNRKVAAGVVWPSFCNYLEGLTCIRLMEMVKAGLIPEIPEKTLEFWKQLFETSSIQDLHNYGSGTISTGWGIVTSYIKLWYAKQKYDELFSKDEDPLYWEKNRHKHSALMNGEIMPFWDKETFKDISDKVRTILQIQVQPDTNKYSRMM